MATFSDLITHTRASTATYVDANGVLQTAAVDEPRVNHHIYDGVRWVNEGVLHESEARTNMALNSGDFSASNWSLMGAGSPTLSVVDGEQRVSWSNGPGNVYDTVSGAFAAGDTLTLSARVKVVDPGGANLTNDFLLYLEAGDRSEGSTAITTLIDDGEYRVVTVSHTFSTTGTNFYIQFRHGGNNSPVLAIEYIQLEEGPTPSSYIPTAGSQVTRAADSMTIPAAKLPYPKPVVIGSELVTNGTFDTDVSGWAIDSNAVGNTATWNPAGYADLSSTNGGAGSILRQLTPVESPNKIYKVSFEVVNVTSGMLNVFISTIGQASYAKGVYELYVSGTAEILVDFKAPNSNVVASVDNVSVREINPLSLSIAVEGRVTYADTGLLNGVIFTKWEITTSDGIRTVLSTNGLDTGNPNFRQANSGDVSVLSGPATYSPGINVPFSIASRHGSPFLNGAVDGTALTENTTPTALPDLSATDFDLGPDFMGTIRQFRMWNDDLGDTGIAEASA